MPELTEKVVGILHFRGPSLPVQLAKAVNSSILFTSAALSELSSQRKVLVSHIKVGDSPLYYLPGQESQLQNFVSNLNPKDQQTLNTLRERKVIKDGGQELFLRVSLRNIKDFAKPLEIDHNGRREIFFKWYLLSNEEADYLIKRELGIIKEEAQKVHKEEEMPVGIKKEAAAAKIEPPQLAEQEKPKVEEKRETVVKIETPIRIEQEKKERKIEKKKELTEEKQKTEKEEIAKPKIEIQRQIIETDIETKDPFFEQIKKQFKEKGILIQQHTLVRRNGEHIFVLNVPTVMGSIIYYCKAKNKKRCDEKELSAAILEAQMKKLPLLFLHTGELTKKAEELLRSNEFVNVLVKQL